MSKNPSPKADWLRAMREARGPRLTAKEVDEIASGIQRKPKPKKKPKKPLRA